MIPTRGLSRSMSPTVPEDSSAATVSRAACPVGGDFLTGNGTLCIQRQPLGKCHENGCFRGPCLGAGGGGQAPFDQQHCGGADKTFKKKSLKGQHVPLPPHDSTAATWRTDQDSGNSHGSVALHMWKGRKPGFRPQHLQLKVLRWEVM